MDKLRKLKHGELAKVAEVIDRGAFLKKTLTKSASLNGLTKSSMEQAGLSPEKFKTMLNGGMLTYLLHW